MSIKHIQARFTSGNDIQITKAMVPLEEWQESMREITQLQYDSEAYYRLVTELDKQVMDADDYMMQY